MLIFDEAKNSNKGFVVAQTSLNQGSLHWGLTAQRTHIQTYAHAE